MTLSSPLTVVAMMNGMIGGVILVLPVSSYQAGYLFTILAILVSGAFSFYSCYLSIKHLGDQKDMNYAMQVHFGTKAAKIVYDIVVWLGLVLGSVFYFSLVCVQWESLTGKQSFAIPISNAALLFVLIFILKYFDLGASLMAYGIVSIFCYLIFLIWVVASAPKGQAKWQPIGINLYTFGATMSLAFIIQTFFIPVLLKNPAKSKHILLTFIAYLVGGCVYAYISFMGSFGIMNRTSLTNDPQTIEDYFRVGNIELRIIQSIYLIHLYSCLPQFILISKKRLFNSLKIQQTNKGKIPFKQIIYALIFLGFCILIRLLGIKIDTIIAINGSIIGFFNVYFFPAILHVKCLYFSKNKRALPADFLKNEEQVTNKSLNVELQANIRATLSNSQDKSERNTIELKDPLFNQQNQLLHDNQFSKRGINQSAKSQQDDSVNSQILQNKIQELKVKKQHENDPQSPDYFYCDCNQPKSLWMKIVQMFFIIIMVALGAAIMVNGLISVV